MDAAHEKEGRAKETIQSLKHEIQNLSRLVEQGAGLSIGQENTVNELVKVKAELAREREAQATQISSLMQEIQQVRRFGFDPPTYRLLPVLLCIAYALSQRPHDQGSLA